MKWKHSQRNVQASAKSFETAVNTSTLVTMKEFLLGVFNIHNTHIF